MGQTSTQRQPVVYLHIGTMKSGTSYLQHLMIANKERLRTAGFLFPGESWACQVRGAQEVLRRTRQDPRVRVETRGAWSALVHEALEHDGTASILSVEFLSFAGSFGAQRVLTSLADAEVHVVLTVRDATAIIPSRWATEVHNGSTVSWTAYTRGLRRALGVPGRRGRLSPYPTVRRFRQAQDIERILHVWERLVTPERLHVVTVPPPGAPRRLLWRRFASVVGVDPAVCSQAPRETNESLGYASTELIRRVNRELGRMRPSDYNPTVKHEMALKALAARRDQETRVRLDLATAEFGVVWNARAREATIRSGAHVVGDLDDLPTHLPEATWRRLRQTQPPPTAEELLAAAEPAVEAMVRLVRRRARRLRNGGEDVSVERYDVTAAAERWRMAPDPVDEAAGDVARLARTAVELHRRLRA